MVEEKKETPAPKVQKAQKVVAKAVKITPKFEVQVGPNHMYLWRMLNGGKVLMTSKVFPVKEDAFAAIRSVKESVPSKSSIEVKTDGGKHFFRVKTSSHQVLATSECFEKSEECEIAVLAARKAPQAVVIDRTL